jgi:hypothetical protein
MYKSAKAYRFNRRPKLVGRPNRDVAISKDDIMSLKIDLEVLSSDEFYKKYVGEEPSGAR